MTIEEWLGNNQLSLDIWHKNFDIENFIILNENNLYE